MDGLWRMAGMNQTVDPPVTKQADSHEGDKIRLE